MLDQGADTCVELSVDLSEILAILNSVLRREIQRSKTGQSSKKIPQSLAALRDFHGGR